MIKQTIKYIILLLSVSLFATSCDHIRKWTQQNNKDVVASVNGEYLLKTNLKNVVPKGTNQVDSLKLVDQFIENWIADIVLYNEAQKKFANDKEIENLVKEYQMSLMRNKYKSTLLEEKLSKDPSNSELVTFYEEHPELFQLKNEIIKGIYVKIPLVSPELDTYKKLYKSDDEGDIEELENKKLQNTVAFENFYDNWTDFDLIVDNIPLKVTDQKEYLKKNKTIEVSDSTFLYLLNIKDYKTDGQAPFDYIQNDVQKIYIDYNSKKIMKDTIEKLVESAKSRGEINY